MVIVLFIFLMNARTTYLAGNDSLSLVITIIVLKLMGLTINTMSLGGMAIAIGSLVDDAIVDVENVFKRLRENRHGQERRTTTRDAGCVPCFEGGAHAGYQFHLDHRGQLCSAFFLSGMEGAHAGTTRHIIHRGLVGFHIGGAHADTGVVYLPAWKQEGK